MKLLERLSRKAEKGSAGNHKKMSGTWELEIYSGMRVLVENLEGNLLFIATLKDPQMHTAELHQYSEMEFLQDTASEALPNAAPVPVRIRGYNDNKRKAVFMEGNMVPKLKHVWQVENLAVTAIENERSDPRLDTDLDAAIMSSDGTDAEEQTCKLFNISIGGAGIGLDHPYHKGDKFFLKAKLFGDKQTFVVYCEVLRVMQKDASQFEYGCQFLELKESSQEQIRQFIARTELAGKSRT